jgi:hypothetical protein
MPLRSRSLLFSVLLLHALVVARQALAAEAELTQSTLDIAAQDPFPLTQVFISLFLASLAIVSSSTLNIQSP